MRVECVVVNVKCDEYDVYIGRGSEWGNRYRIGVDGDRDEVIRKYREWLIGRVVEEKGLLSRMRRELGGKKLGCWCKVRGKEVGCHGDVIKELVEDEMLMEWE